MREHAPPPSPEPLLQGEEQVFFWSEENHVIGDLRAELKRQITKRNLEEWKQQEHQGRVARRVGPAALTHAKTIRRFAWLCRAPEMLVFFLQAMCEWLPTRGRDTHSAPTFEERTCLWCSNEAVDDLRHALSWPTGMRLGTVDGIVYSACCVTLSPPISSDVRALVVIWPLA